MNPPGDMIPRPANLQATIILDVNCEEVRSIAEHSILADQSARTFLQRVHHEISQIVRPIYSVDEWQSVSRTLRKMRGSCSQRMACLEAVARAGGIPTRVRALHLKGSFWYPRFRYSRPFIPRQILLVWPQFWLESTWTDFDELYLPLARLAALSDGFRNDGESLFEAVQKMPVDFLGKTCGLACSKPGQDLSRFVLDDAGFFDTRDEVFQRFGSFQRTWRGRAFEAIFGGRKSS